MEKSIKKNTVWKMLLNIFNIIIPIITGPYLARTLDVYLYGEYNRALSVVAFLVPFAGCGIYNYGIREVSKVRNNPEKISKVFSVLFCVGAGSTVSVLIFYFIYVFNAIELELVPVYAALSLQLLACMFWVEYMNEAFENYSFILIKTVLIRLVNIILILLIVRRPGDILKYAIIVSCIQLLNYLISFIYIKTRVGFIKVSLADIKDRLKALLVMFVLMNAGMLYTYLDKLFLSVFSKGVYVSYYTFSQAIINILTGVINAIILVTIPRLSLYLGENKKEDYQLLLRKSSGLFYMLSIPVCLGFFVLSQSIMYIYGGSNYLGAGVTFGLFSLRMLVWMVDYTSANQVLFIYGKEKWLTKLYLIFGIGNLIVKSILAFGGVLNAETAIVSTACVEIMIVVIEQYLIKTKLDSSITILKGRYWKYLIFSILFIPIERVFRHIFQVEYKFNVNFFFYLGCTISICAIYYFIVLFIRKDESFIYALSMVKENKLFKKVCKVINKEKTT